MSLRIVQKEPKSEKCAFKEMMLDYFQWAEEECNGCKECEESKELWKTLEETTEIWFRKKENKEY